ncbi:unnamed protein product [Gongylonema pulchrum]|uniref:Uncharacterized protein n=1 Tax=Gongylonema pulchrum TaxID=637853 RepID=A0A183EJW4_9BILA|nr:unnamed protein product [Gongylonema pulchrum]
MPSTSRSNRTENFLHDRSTKLKWHVNPLYKVKTINIDESESESVASLSSWRSCSRSEHSFDSGYKSNDNAKEREMYKDKNFEKLLRNQEMNFHEAATELLDAMKALGAGEEVNALVERTLEACEHELEKMHIDGEAEQSC